jgi:chromosome segregation ATPase
MIIRKKVKTEDIPKQISEEKIETTPNHTHLQYADLQERLSELEDLQMLLEVELIKIKEMLFNESGSVVAEVPADINAKLNDIEARISSLEQVTENFEKLEEIENKIKEFENKVENKVELRFDANKFDELRNEILSLKSRLNEIETATPSVSPDGKLLIQLKNEMKEYSEKLEKRLSDLDRLESRLRDELQEIDLELENKIDKKLDMKIPNFSEATKKFEDFEQKINNINRRVEQAMELANSKLDIDNRIEKKIDEFRRDIINDVRKEVNKQRVGIDFEERLDESKRELKKAIEKDLEELTIKHITEKLDKFTNMLDKRLPKFVSVDEYRKDIHYLEHKLNDIVKPDLSLLNHRIDELDKKVTDLINVLRIASLKKPIIVE